MSNGYDVNMRQDKRTGEYLAFMPDSYDMGRGRYYMAYTLSDAWVEVSPEYATRACRTVSEFPGDLKRAVDSNLGYLLNLTPRLRG
jgi:hypothetical protein